jgi:hypothetical protein
MKDTYELRPLLAEIRDGYRGMRDARRTQRAARQHTEHLRRELASYTSPSDRDDLQAILARHSDEETAQIRALLLAGPPSGSRAA